MMLRRTVKLTLTIILALLAMLLLTLLHPFGITPLKQAVQRGVFQLVEAIWGLRVTVEGVPAPPPCLLVANHCSYLDVMVLGAHTSLRFTPKRDVKSWPLIGWLVTVFDVIFVDRRPTTAKEAQQSLLTALSRGARVCLFPEGGTNDGRSLKPFKSSLFSLVEQYPGAEPLLVQLAVVRYLSVDGAEMNNALWDDVAWYREEEGIMGHILRLLGHREIRIHISFFPPRTLQPGETRKQLAAALEAETREVLRLPRQQ